VAFEGTAMGRADVWNGPDIVVVEMVEACLGRVVKQRNVQVLRQV
jgi:hypothetical protein